MHKAHGRVEGEETGGKQHVVLLNTENAGRGDARGGGTELSGSECHSIHGV
jgi:hypothetical protein